MWAHSGSELFFVDAARRSRIAAEVETDQGFRVLQRETLFVLETGIVADPGVSIFEITPDDQRFLTIRLNLTVPTGESGRFILVENWFEELREQAGN